MPADEGWGVGGGVRAPAFWAPGRTAPAGDTHQHALTHVLAKHEFGAGSVSIIGGVL